MEARRRYRAPDDAALARLMRERDVAGLRIDPMPPIEVCDRYLDTSEGALIRQGVVLRLRAKDDAVLASLRLLEGEAEREVAHARYEQLPGDEGLDLPDDGFRSAVEERTGGEALEVLLIFRQYRAPRALYDGDRLAGLLSLDVVADETDPEGITISHEVEVELVATGTPDDLRRLDRKLLEAGLNPDPYSKVERAFLRRSLRDINRLLLLPQERAALQQFGESDAAVERRRAEAILLASDGHDDAEISRRVGLAPTRVRHWRDAFRTDRMRIFDGASRDPLVLEDEETEAPFTVSELVSDPTALARARGRETGSREKVDDLFERLRHETSEQAAEPLVKALPPVVEPVRNDSLIQAEHWVHLSFGDDAAGLGDFSSAESQGPQTRVVEFVPSLAAADGLGPAVGEREPPSHPVPTDQPLSALTAPALEAAADDLDGLAAFIQSEVRPQVLREALSALDRVLSMLDLLPGEGRGRLSAEGEALRVDLLTLRFLDDAMHELGDPGTADTSVEDDPLTLALTLWDGDKRRILEAGGEEPSTLSVRVRSFAARLRAASASAAASPSALRVKDVLASSVWRQYEAVRALEERIDSVELDLLQACGRLSGLEHKLMLLGGSHALGARQAVARAGRELFSYVYRTDLARRLEICADWVSSTGGADPAMLDEARDVAASAATAAGRRFVGVCRTLFTERFRVQLAQATASI